jgi:hypothetical protein
METLQYDNSFFPTKTFEKIEINRLLNKKINSNVVKKPIYQIQVMPGIEEQIINWIMNHEKPLFSLDINTLMNFCIKDGSPYDFTDEHRNIFHLINIYHRKKENNYIQFYILQTMVFAYIHFDTFEYTQYFTDEYIFQMYYRNQWCCQKIYNRTKLEYVHQIYKKFCRKTCNKCKKDVMEFLLISNDECLNCSIIDEEKILNNDIGPDIVDIEPEMITIEKIYRNDLDKVIIQKTHRNIIDTDNKQTSTVNKQISIDSDANKKLFDVESKPFDCLSNRSWTKWYSKTNMDHMTRQLCLDLKNYNADRQMHKPRETNPFVSTKILSEIFNQKIKLDLDFESLYHYHNLNGFATIIFHKNNNINYYRHIYTNSHHIIYYKNNNRMVSFVVFDCLNTQKFDITNIDLMTTDEILNQSFKCCESDDPNIYCRYFHFSEELNDQKIHKKILANKKEIIFDGYYVDKKNTLDENIVASCEEPNEPVIYRNKYKIDDPLFYKKIIKTITFERKLKIVTKNVDSKCTYLFEIDFELIIRKIEYTKPEYNNQMHIYYNNRLFILYYKNSQDEESLYTSFLNPSKTYERYLPIRGNLIVNDTKVDIYDYTMIVYYKDNMVFLLDYHNNAQMKFQDNIYDIDMSRTNLFGLYNICHILKKQDLGFDWKTFKNQLGHIYSIMFYYHNDDLYQRFCCEPEFVFNQNMAIRPISNYIINGTDAFNGTDTFNVTYKTYDSETENFMVGLGFFQRCKNIVIETMENLQIVSKRNIKYDVIGVQTSDHRKDQNNVAIKIDIPDRTMTFVQIGYKACKTSNNRKCIVKLGIYPTSKIVYSAKYNKYRTNKAFVLDILNLKGEEFFFPERVAFPFIYVKDKSFTYNLHQDIEVKCFDESTDNDCSNGIHYHNDISDIKRWFDYTLADLYEEVPGQVVVRNGEEYQITMYVPIFKLELFDYYRDGVKYNNLYTSEQPINQDEIHKNKLIHYIREYIMQKSIYHSEVVTYLYEEISKLRPNNETLTSDEVIDMLDKICDIDKNMDFLRINNSFVNGQRKNEDTNGEYKNEDTNDEFKNEDISDEYKNENISDEYKNEDINDEFKNEDINNEYKNEDINDEFKNEDINDEYDYIKIQQLNFNKDNEITNFQKNDEFIFGNDDEFIFGNDDELTDCDEIFTNCDYLQEDNNDNIIVIPRSSSTQVIRKRKCVN